jgi:hypothetical protein
MAYTLLSNGDFFLDIPIPLFVEVTQNDEEDHGFFNFICATVFYNFGLSQSLLVNNAMTVEIKNRPQGSAFAFFKLCQQLLLFTPKNEKWKHSMLLDMLLMRCLVQNHVGSDLDQSSIEQHRKELNRMIEDVEEHNRFIPAAHELRNASAA